MSGPTGTTRYHRRPVAVPADFPESGAAMFHGVIGKLARSVEELSEADPVAIVASVLAYVSAVAGREHYLTVSGQRFTPALFVALVGATADGRKGTASGVARTAMELAMPGETADLCRSGFGSGEGLVRVLAEASGKGLLIEDEEFGGILTPARREGSTLSPVIHKMWDGGRLANVVKDGEVVAEGYHASLLAHITPAELEAQLAPGERETGFANRFLLIACQRRFRIDWDSDGDCTAFMKEQLRPHAELLGHHLRAALPGVMKTSTSGWEAWVEHRERECDEWMRSRRGGHLGRLALVYALADGASEVTGQHVEAAAAVCDYAEATAAHVFGPLSGDCLAQRVLTAVLNAERGLSLTDLQRRFANHLTPADRDRVVAKLEKARLIEKQVENTRGRPRVRLVAVEPATEATKATEVAQRAA